MEKETPVIQFITNHYESILKITVMMLHDSETAQDVLHNVAVSIYAKQDSLYEVANPPAYFFTCLQRAVLNYFRDNAWTLSTDPVEMAEMYSEQKNKVMLDYVEWEIILRKHLKGYPEKLIQAFLKHYMEDHTLEELADKLGMTPNALSQQFRRMRIKIAKQSPDMTLYMFILTLR